MTTKSEMQFLVDLLLNDKLAKSTQQKVKDRMIEVEEAMRAPGMVHRVSDYTAATLSMPVAPRTTPQAPTSMQASTQQSESTRRLLEKYPDLAMQIDSSSGAQPVVINSPVITPQQITEPITVTNSIAVGQALAARQAMMQEATMPVEQRQKIRRTGLKTHG